MPKQAANLSEFESDNYFEDQERNAPIHPFSKLKAKLQKMGIELGEATPYHELEVEDVTQEEVDSGAIEFTDDGIFVTANGIRQQVYLYKRSYRLNDYGLPRAHIRKCETIEAFTSNGSVPLYRRANTNTVWVRDMNDGLRDKQVSNLPLCKNCCRRTWGANPNMKTSEFVESLKDHSTENTENTEVDIFGYTKDWEAISNLIRKEHDYTCEVCGLKIDNPYDQHFIHVHHKNGRKEDNRLNNLQCLCLRCHSSVDTLHYNRLRNRGANRVLFEEFVSKYPEPEGYQDLIEDTFGSIVD